MTEFAIILVSIVATLVGVHADVTFWKTSTYTETAWSAQAPPASTIWNTETYTETAWSTYIPPAVTISIPYTVTSVLEKDYTNILISTVEKDYTTTVEKDYTTTVEEEYTTTITETSVSVSVVASLATKYSEYTTTLTSVVISLITEVCTPVTIKQPTTITIPPTTVTVSPVITTTSLIGIVTCPSRTINPTYTTSTQLPDEYTWGCPAGYLCKPPQINCNFEQNPPADTYYCSPDECVPAPPYNKTGPGCGPYQTALDYFNFNPELFGLSYSIFVDGGNYAQTCSGCAMTTLAPVSQISDGQPQAPTLVPVCQISDGQVQAPAPTKTLIPVTTISDGQPQGPVTSAARLARRQINQALPDVCYEDCNVCLGVAERDGKAKCCPADSQFSSAYEKCSLCLSAHRTDTLTEASPLLPSLQPFLVYCDAHKNVATASPPAEITTSPSPIPPSSTPTQSSITTTPSSSSTPAISSSSHSSSPSASPATIFSSTKISTAPSSITSPAACDVSQISDGQPQACTNATTSSITTFTGAAGHTFSRPSLFWSSPMGWAFLLFVNAL